MQDSASSSVFSVSFAGLAASDAGSAPSASVFPSSAAENKTAGRVCTPNRRLCVLFVNMIISSPFPKKNFAEFFSKG